MNVTENARQKSFTRYAMIAGPLASVIINRQGLRRSLLTGGALVFTGYFLTFFVTSFVLVFLLFGLMAGTGLGIVFSIATMVPSMYFDKHLDAANGIVSSGVAFGSLIMPPLIRVVVDWYGWRGGMLILSAITLHIVLGALMMRPVDRLQLVIEIPLATEQQDCDDSQTVAVDKASE